MSEPKVGESSTPPTTISEVERTAARYLFAISVLSIEDETRITTGALQEYLGILVVRTYIIHLEWSSLGLGYGMLLGALIVVLTVTTRRSHAVEEQFRSPLGVTALGLALGTTAGTALLEVRLRGFTLFAAGVRVLHLLAFAVWIGGAVWNIFVAVPTGQKRPTVVVVRAAGAQLERFRWTVRIIIPTLILTGLYQAVTALGTSGRVYFETPVGLAVLAKVGFIGALIVIFKLCPMWRACSPIDGVCDLDTQATDSDRSDRTEVTNGD